MFNRRCSKSSRSQNISVLSYSVPSQLGPKLSQVISVLLSRSQVISIPSHLGLIRLDPKSTRSKFISVSSQLGPKSSRSKSSRPKSSRSILSRSQVISVPSQLGPKLLGPKLLGPKSSRSTVISVPSHISSKSYRSNSSRSQVIAVVVMSSIPI